jgi:hypothetical protein
MGCGRASAASVVLSTRFGLKFLAEVRRTSAQRSLSRRAGFRSSQILAIDTAAAAGEKANGSNGSASRVYEIGPRDERLRAIANDYVKDPHATLVVSPDNQSRQDINDAIHRVMQREGHVDHDEHRTRVLVPRQEITGADRQWAERYEEGDVVR